jgi:predicted nucleotidyltransferase
LTRIPENIRKALEKTVTSLRAKENVYGVGLFGSWSRGDATPASDVDLLILDKGNFDCEYVERTENKGLFIDLNYVPKRWIHGMIPPEIDQKLFEMQILYDRDWSLNNTKLLMAKSYGSPERVDIRTEAHVVDSDIFLSRATSAFSREDFQSARLFAVVALESILRVLIEIALEPFSNSRFVERLEFSTAKLGMHGLFNEYLDVARLDEVDDECARERLRLFRLILDELKVTVEQNSEALESSHFWVRTKLRYYLSPAFVQGVVMRTGLMIDSGRVGEASRYLSSIFLDVAENYVWLKASVDGVKVDYTVLVRSLERLESKNLRSYEYVVKFLELGDVGKVEVAGVIQRIREVMFRIRRERKALIKNHVIRA